MKVLTAYWGILKTPLRYGFTPRKVRLLPHTELPARVDNSPVLSSPSLDTDREVFLPKLEKGFKGRATNLVCTSTSIAVATFSQENCEAAVRNVLDLSAILRKQTGGHPLILEISVIVDYPSRLANRIYL